MATVRPRSFDRAGTWPAPAVVAGALAAGVLWGMLARGWMRLISTEPEFTLSGSVFVVSAFGVAATCQALALVARRRRSAWLKGAGRVVGIVGMLPLFIGAGMTMMPTVVGGGLALGQRGWPRSLRLLAAALAVLPALAITSSLVADFGFGLRLLAGAAGLVILYVGVVAAVSANLGRAADAQPLPRAVRTVLVVTVPVLLLLATVGLAGLRGG